MRVAIVLAFVLVATIAPATCQAPWWRGQAIKRLGQGQQQFRPNNRWLPPQDPEAAQEMRERMAEQAERDAEAAEELREQEEERAQELQEQQAEAEAEAAQNMQQQHQEEEGETAQEMQQQDTEAAQELAEQEAEAAQELAEQEAEAAEEESEAEAEAAEDLREQQEEAAEAEAEALEDLQEQEAESEAREEMQGEAAEGVGEGQIGSVGTSFSLGGSQYQPSIGGGSAGPSFYDPTGGLAGSGGSGSYGGSSYGGHQGATGGSNGVPGGAGGAGGSPGDVPGGGNIGVNGAATGGVATGSANGAAPNGAANSGTNGTTNGTANGAAPNGTANSSTSGAAPNGTATSGTSGATNSTANGGAANGATGAAGSTGMNGNGGVGSQGTAGSSQGSTSTWTSSTGAEGVGQSIGSSFAGSTNFGAPNEPNIAFAPAPLAQAADAQLTPAETAALDNTYMDKHLCGGFMGANGISGKKDLAVLALDYAGMKQALDPCNVPKNGRTTGRTPVNIAFRTGMETHGQDPASSVLRDLPGMIQRYQQTPIKVHLFSWYTPSEHALRSLLTKKRRGGLANAEVVLGYVEESKMALFSALLGDTTFTNLLGQLQQAGISVNRVCDTCSQIANLTNWQRKRQGLVNGVGVFDQQAGQCGPVAEVPATDQLALSAPQCQSFQESMGSCIFGKLTAACPWLRHAQAASEQPLAATMHTWSTECGKNLDCWQGKGAYLSYLARSAASCRVSQYGASAAIGQCVGAGQNTPLDPAPTQPSL